jgi:hypothetical protein
LVLQVRIAAAQQLPALARVLGAAAAVSQVLPELKELLEDDEVQVRQPVAGERMRNLCRRSMRLVWPEPVMDFSAATAVSGAQLPTG